MRNIVLASLFLAIVTSGLAESKENKHDWSNVKKIKQETWVQVKTMDGRQLEGQLGDFLGEKILLIQGTKVTSVAKEEIREISKKKRDIAKSILIGAAVGYGSGLAAGLVLESGSSGEDKGLFTALLATSGCIVGTAATALDSIDRWRLVYKRKEN